MDDFSSTGDLRYAGAVCCWNVRIFFIFNVTTVWKCPVSGMEHTELTGYYVGFTLGQQ